MFAIMVEVFFIPLQIKIILKVCANDRVFYMILIFQKRQGSHQSEQMKRRRAVITDRSLLVAFKIVNNVRILEEVVL